jgi:succinoglycan biosynthesis protein ExoM
MIETYVKPVVAPATETTLVSVVMPVYQGQGLVLGAVRSALNQTHRDLEVLVVDDGSSDATLAVLATVQDPRLRVLRQQNAGTAAARNRALAQARGRYIAFLDCDDRWFPGKIEAEISVLEHAPEPIAVAYSSYYAVDDRGRLLNPAPNRDVSGSVFDVLLDGEDFLIPSACLFDRRIFDSVGNFETGRFHEDHDFVLRVAQRYSVYPTRERFVVYRQSTSGKCRGVLADFERARSEELSLISGFAATLTADQLGRLKQNVLRSLYCRFLMYGFSDHARRLLSEVDLSTLRKTKKGLLAALFAKTGINLLILARTIIQGLHLQLRQGAWQKRLARSCLELGYENGAANAPDSPAVEPPQRNAEVRVCVAIPTFRRPDLLKALLRGISLQLIPAQCSVEVLVLDNDAQASSRHVVEAAADDFPYALRYAHVPEPGLSLVRNAALAHAREGFDFLAMIDDDEYPQTQWLQELLRVAERIGVDAVIGPVPKQLSVGAPKWIETGGFFELPSHPDGALINDGYSGNCLLRVRSLERFGVTFDSALNLAGGEDMLFFRELLARGAKIAYAARAVAFETIGPARLHASYILKLSYRRGNTLAFCDRRLKGSPLALVIRALKGYGRLAVGLATLLPLVLTGGRAGAVRALSNVAHGLGSLAGLGGHLYEAYKRAEPSRR